MTFDEWMAEVDNLFYHKFMGLSSLDMEDYNWWGLYDDELTPQEAFDEFLEYSNYDYDNI